MTCLYECECGRTRHADNKPDDPCSLDCAIERLEQKDLEIVLLKKERKLLKSQLRKARR